MGFQWVELEAREDDTHLNKGFAAY
ncbi:uncharacterized protein METZ01_LOCUS209946 [marine metagenome]|uniref:Uncharacterized protein n=1 Tax=marine metagenome TaxID=408172 RepID=A0A382F382_9ZZZZ